MRSRSWALLLLAAAGCSRCGAKPAASALELLPPHPGGAVVAAPLGVLAQHLSALADRAVSLPGGDQIGDGRRALAAQLGFDPLTRDGLLAAGLDPERGAALALLAGPDRPDWIAALPVAKSDAFLATVQRLAERSGFAPAAQQPQGARVYEGRGRRMAVAVIRGFGVLARTADPAASVAEADARPPGQSLTRDPGLDGARKRLGAQDLIFWAPAGSGLPPRLTSRTLPGDAALSLQAAEQGIALRMFAQLPQAQAREVQAALPGGGASLVELLPPEAPVRGRLGIAPARLLESLRGNPELGPLLARLHGADAEAFASVAPGVAVALMLAKGANLGQAVDYGFDWRVRSPFETVQLVALAEVRDRQRLLRALEQVGKELPALGARVGRSGDDFQVSYPAGKGARFGVREIEGKPIAYLMGGPLRPDELRRTPRAAELPSAVLYADAGAALRVDFGKLAASLRALPQDAYGSGPQAYVSRSFVSQVIEPLRTVRLMLSAEAFPDRLGATLDVELSAP